MADIRACSIDHVFVDEAHFFKNLEWKQADSYGADDLLLLAKLLDQAHSLIICQPPALRQVG